MMTFKNYHANQIEAQEEIHILGGVEKLTDKELKEIANFFGIEDYKVDCRECRSTSIETMGELDYYSYVISYGSILLIQENEEKIR